jgi:hypothetical protein
MAVARNLPVGTMCYLIEEEEVYLRVRKGFRVLEVSFLL